MNIFARYAIWIMATITLGYPVAALASHGLDPSLWPSDVIKPGAWLSSFTSLSWRVWADAYWMMMIGHSPAFPAGGVFAFVGILGPVAAWALVRNFGELPAPLRDGSGIFGRARFATPEELDSMQTGLELGRNPRGGAPVRVNVEGTLVTIAPPRKGKTSGLLIPNLTYPEPHSWDGPAVVLDTKGEIYRAIGDRRRALGRNAICLDPLNLVGGDGRWNPLEGVRSTDILYLQRSALALLPEADTHSESSAYFRNRAVDLIVGAMIGAIRSNKRTPFGVYHMLSDEELLQHTLSRRSPQNPAVLAALEVLAADPKTKDPIKSTALQAFQWMADVRLRRLVSRNTFAMSDICSSEADFFVAVPPEYKKLLAPFLRWFLSDLFAAIRKDRPSERVFIYVDEAAALGRFDEILVAAAELPGYNASLWTFWQDRSQIVSLYGESGASTLINTADVVTVFNMSSVNPDENERWSRTIGEFTALVSTTNEGSADNGSSGKSTSPQAARLMTPSELATMRSDELIAFVNSGGYSRHPMRLRKIKYNDARFERFIKQKNSL